MKSLTSTAAALLDGPRSALRAVVTNCLRAVAYLAFGALLTVIVAAIWWLAFLLGWASPPSLAALAGSFLPVLRDLGQFAQYNLSHNLPFVLAAAALFTAFEITFRRQVAAGKSPLGTLGLYKATALLLGLFTMAISLFRVLSESTQQGQDPRVLIGSLYFKFGLWVLTAVLMLVRFVWFEGQQTAARHE